MGMQVVSLSMGGSIVVPAQKEQKPTPLPIEGKEASANTDVSLPGTQKTQTPDVKQTVSDLEYAFNRRLQFIIDQESKELIVKVIDNETDTVIKVLPPEELQRLHNRVRETMGFLFDRMV